MKETRMSLAVDNVVLSARIPLGATLAQFLQHAGLADKPEVLTDGVRVLSPELELAYRFRDLSLSTDVPPALRAETPAILVDDLLVVAERG